MSLILPFQHLHFVTISTQRRVELDDDALMQMAEAWPNLSYLSINYTKGWEGLPKTSLQVVRAVLNKLTQLHTLRIAVNVRSISAEDLVGESGGRSSIDKPFNSSLLDSAIGENIHEIAAFLANEFPRMGYPGSTDYSWVV
ncbi:hypothetical protein CONPUDRAFT_148229 [Coniophora puteana RWD-64-598 SS2]|uniref:F-box domain-containing protein n=1 Tax=Coniophora puteana (strain RWD-64-598) TaxID=741705 RepID=A0A5M3N3X8_CONPW|nr:uncharacterized protein CONPUDRAFT_148229 [Coniophora puteana RWD-64-598 SS2]EIW86120.1 hypothetical protein CONPUDRAFT_148229 [Coniophora puteana RWD-64-598 SS2]